nr:hypothetical protein [Tanacetum cinerariifolium]
MPRLCLKPYKKDLVVMMPQRTFLKQMFMNFNAPSTESLDSIFNRLQKIINQLAILGENISQEDLNIKFLRSLPSEWNTHVVDWRNKADLDTMSIDDLYNNFKIVEQEVKRTFTSSSSSGSQNMAFLSSHGNTNEVDTANIQVSTISTPVSTVSSHDNTANLSDATMYAFLANQPNGSQLVHEDLEPIHEDDQEEIDLKWQLALLCIRARRGLASVEEQLVFYKKNEVMFCDQMAVLKRDASFRDLEINALNIQLEKLKEKKESNQIKIENFENTSKSFDKLIGSKITNNSRIGYGPKNSKSVCVDTSNEIKEAPDAPIIKDWVSDIDEDKSKEMVLKSNNVQQKHEQANQPWNVS